MKSRLLVAIVVAAGALSQVACKNSYDKPLKVSLKTDVDSASYALGAQLGSTLKNDGLDTTLVISQFFAGLQNAILGKDNMTDEEKQRVIQAFVEKETTKQLSESKEKQDAFLSENAKKPGVKTTGSGLQYEVISEGAGAKPSASSTVKVHYKGSLISGDVFDSSEGMDPVEFPLDRVIPGWTEGIQLMSVGSKYKFYIPGDLAYGPQGQPQAGIGPNEVLVFEVELLGVK